MMKQAIIFPGSMRTVVTELLAHTLKAFSHRTVCKGFPGRKPFAQRLECFWDSLEVFPEITETAATRYPWHVGAHGSCSPLSLEQSTVWWHLCWPEDFVPFPKWDGFPHASQIYPPLLPGPGGHTSEEPVICATAGVAHLQFQWPSRWRVGSDGCAQESELPRQPRPRGVGLHTGF